MTTRKNKNITRIVNKVNKSSADFVNRLKDPNRLSIPDWEDSRYTATHKLGVGTDNNGQVFIYPSVQNINGKLVDFTNPKFGKWDGMDSAIERGDTVHVDNIQDGLDFTENYKRYYPTGKTFKCGGRRKAQLGLDIQYGGIAIPIAKDMVYFDGNKHEAGGIGIGKDLEVEGGEVGQRKGNSLRVFSSVPFLNGISPAQLVMGGINPDSVFKAQEDFKDRHHINDDGTTYENGGETKSNSAIRTEEDKKVSARNRAIYSAVDATADYPTWWQAIGLGIGSNFKTIINPNSMNYAVTDSVADAAWRKRLGLSYNDKFLIPNKDGSVRLPRNVEMEIPTDTTMLKKRIIANEKFANQSNIVGEDWQIVQAMMKKDKEALEALRKTYKTGEPVVVNEYAHNTRKLSKNGELIDDAINYKSPLNVMKNYTIQYDPKNKNMNYWDTYDFNEFEWGVPGKPFEIKGNIPLKKAGGIYIKPSKRGTFTAAASKHDMGVQEFASKVLANKENYNPAMVKKANFARNASRWKKEYGGSMIYTINGNVKNGLNLRSKALFGTRKKFAAGGEDEEPKEKKINANTKIGTDGLIYRKSVDGNWYTDGTKYEDSEYYFGNTSAQQRSREKIKGRVKEENKGQVLDEVTVSTYKPRKPFINDKGYVRVFKNGEWDYVENEKGDYINIFDNPEEASKILGYKPNIKLDMDYNTYYVFDKNYNRWFNANVDAKSVIDKHTEPIEAKEGKHSETKTIGSIVYEKDANGKWIPTTKTVNDVTNYVRTGANNIGTITTNPLTGERINADNIVETETPSVKGKTRIGTKASPRRGETQTGTTSTSSRPRTTTTAQEAPAIIRREEYYAQPKVGDNEYVADEAYSARQARGTEAVNEALTTSPFRTKTKTDEIDEPLLGKFKTVKPTDFIDLGSNLIGSVASHFINKDIIDKYPMPTKPVMTPVVNFNTRYDVSGDIADIDESRRIATDAYRRNTQSSTAYLNRLQSGLNTAYRQKAEARRYGERMTNQLINTDLQNRQNVYARNAAAQNDYYNRLLDSKRAKSQLEMQNLNSLISGLTGGVTSIMSNIDARANYNRMAQAIQAANPNVDPRLLGIYDYYRGQNTGKKYNKHGK